jgi:hypothetical protein
MNTKDKNLIAYCGLYCGDCPIGKREIADLAKKLMEKLNETDFPRIAQGLPEVHKEYRAFDNYQKFDEVLALIGKINCGKPCKDGGGEESCQIRNCCQEKKIEGCWECEEFENCQKLMWIKPVNQDNHIKNLRIIKHQGIDTFLKGEKNW